MTLYSYEMEQYIKDRNYYLTAEEGAELMNTDINTQIVMIKYYGFNNEYQINTSDGYILRFNIK